MLTIEWLDYKETATNPSRIKKKAINPDIAKILIHPDTTNPKVITK